MLRHQSAQVHGHTHTHFTFVGFPTEMLRCEDYNEKADVWSFGVVLWEVGEQGGRVACPCESSVLHCFLGVNPPGMSCLKAGSVQVGVQPLVHGLRSNSLV